MVGGALELLYAAISDGTPLKDRLLTTQHRVQDSMYRGRSLRTWTIIKNLMKIFSSVLGGFKV
jgi:hypothetical protein